MLSHLQIKNPKDDETPIESATQIFASALPHPYIPNWKKLYMKPKSYSFELYLLSQSVYFYVTTPADQEEFIKSLISSSYPASALQKTTDPMDIVLKSKHVMCGELFLNSSFFYPIKTYRDFKDVDPMSSLVGYLSKQHANLKIAVQLLVQPASFAWQTKAVAEAKHMLYDETAARYTQDPQKKLILQKASFQGGRVLVRIVIGSNTVSDLLPHLRQVAGTFGSFSLGEGNQFVFRRPLVFQKQLLKRIKDRSAWIMERKYQVLNSQELATLWHPPGFLLSGIKNIAWGKTLIGEPPENLPTADALDEDQKKDANFFARTEFKNKDSIFGLKTPDRRKHVYIIGKTGAGKSTLISNMAIDDIRRDRGVAIVDPHGDLSETILDYIPKRRMNDVVYLEPFDTKRPFSLNILEIKNKQHKDLISSGIVSIFYKLYGDSWGPRLEYILRNIILTLLEVPDSTLPDVLKILTDNEFRKKIVSKLEDQVLKNFWENEFARMPDKMKAEAISPIQNKVGQFVSSKMIRNIIGQPKSSIDLEKIMNEGKILILNLSQGKLGEDNASLLGAMIITQIQLAAMNRAFMKEEERRDFFMYVDEFQNFATSSFVKILSEARKYRLSLTLTNQYIEQLDETIQKAIFGNIGTLISFVIGARDAYIISREFGELYAENDLVSLGQFEIVLKLSVNGATSAPFPAHTLPLPSVKNENRAKIVQLSKEKFGRS